MRTDNVTIPSAKNERASTKRIPATQAALDALPLDSGCWRVDGVQGLYVRARKRTKSFIVQRRVRGRVVHRVLGPMRMSEARRLAPKVWAEMKPKPVETKRLTLGDAWTRFLEERELAPTTRDQYAASLRRYFADWIKRPLHDIAEDRAGVRRFFLKMKEQRGAGIALRVLREFSAVWNHWLKVDPTLGPSPTTVVNFKRLPPRDWAYSDDELRRVWSVIETLPPVRRTLWKTLLFTGARAGSVATLRWSDIDFENEIIRFRVAKGGRTYSIPMCSRLADLLNRWKSECPPTDEGWVFPGRGGEHFKKPRGVEPTGGTHRLRHSYRTMLAGLGCPPDTARMLLGHSLSTDVSSGYITPQVITESLRPWSERVSQHYARILGLEDGHAQA
jgi:integrase/recombinase XerC